MQYVYAVTWYDVEHDETNHWFKAFKTRDSAMKAIMEQFVGNGVPCLERVNWTDMEKMDGPCFVKSNLTVYGNHRNTVGWYTINPLLLID